MRLGLLTFHASNNYGAALQAHALQRELERLGHEPEFVHYYTPATEARNRYRRPVRRPADLAAALGHRLFGPSLRRRHERFERFRAESMRLGPRFRDFDGLKAARLEYDAFVCGSDQIWNFTDGPSPVYYLRFADPAVPAIAYAPSFGRSFTAGDAPAELGEWIDRFQFLSAREASGVELIAALTGRRVPQTLDPAFFLNGAEWAKLADAPDFDRPYLLFYALETSRRTCRLVAAVARRLGLAVVVAGKGGGFVLTGKARLAIDSGPSEFLGWLRGARFVLSNSFHATVFALRFGVPFVTVAHSSRNARMESLLQAVGEERRMVRDLADLERDPALLEAPLDAPAAERRLAPALDDSRRFLAEALEGIARHAG